MPALRASINSSIRRSIQRSIASRRGYVPSDANAAAYIAAVESADGAQLEDAVRAAIDSFVLGCKADGIWNAIKASCILAGARTLNGALVPLVGAAPTNFNFVSGDYDRKTGLVGDGSTKYLNTNRANDADPQDSNHNAIFVSSPNTYDATRYCMSGGGVVNGTNSMLSSTTSQTIAFRNRANTGANRLSFLGGFAASDRSSATAFITRINGTNVTTSTASQTPTTNNIFLYAVSPTPAGYYSNARLAFYSIGEFLDLALLDARVTTLVNAIGAALP
jgi:hypothetical protein